MQLGFQGTSPSTDFRSTGCLGLDHLLHVSHSSPTRAQRLIAESVEGGAHWYPLAIVSIGASADNLLLIKTDWHRSNDRLSSKSAQIIFSDIVPSLRFQ